MGATTEHELFARCASGFEKVLSAELGRLGLRHLRPLRGGVSFLGTLTDAYRACLWSRVATRVQLVLLRVDAQSAEALYGGVRAFAWEAHMRRGATIAVSAHGTNAALRNTKFCALKVKDGVCDRLVDTWGARPNVDAHHPDVALDVAVHEHKATIYLNLSGESLHRRGYREDGVQTEAPLKETLAAGLLLAAGWPDIARRGGAFVDAMCGSGTLVVEAAMIALQVAPGLLRQAWGFLGWQHHDEGAWQALVDDARQVAEQARESARGLVALGGDLDPEAVRIARANAERAGLGSCVQFFADDAARLGRHLRPLVRMGQRPGLMATNPPYGERLLAQSALPATYAALAQAASALPDGWDLALITPDAGVDSYVGRTPRSTLCTYNGPLEVCVRCYRLQDAQQVCEAVSLGGKQRGVPVADAQSGQFGARLRKVAKERGRWARRHGISCYRVYDADLPDYPFSVDLYVSVGEGRTYAVVTECRRPRGVDATRAAHRLADATQLVCALLDVDMSDVAAHAYPGPHKAGGRQGLAPASRTVRVEEAGCLFDVGLDHPQHRFPLVQRGLRAYAREAAGTGRVACLFAASATLGVASAVAGARCVVVDPLRARTSDLARMATINGLPKERFSVTCANVHAWLVQEARARHTYEAVLLCPPEWLPPKAAGGKGWDFSRDYVGLLRAATRVLSLGGSALLVCGDPAQTVDVSAVGAAGMAIEDIGASLLPHDFARSTNALRAYRVILK